MDIRIELIKKALRQELIQLYREAGWWKDQYDTDSTFLDRIVENSALFAGAFLGNRLIGMGRALSDMVSDAYIQDVAVLGEFRHQGIGTEIIRRLTDELRSRGVDWIGLVSEPDAKAFYRRLGFEELKNYAAYQLTIPE